MFRFAYVKGTKEIIADLIKLIKEYKVLGLKSNILANKKQTIDREVWRPKKRKKTVLVTSNRLVLSRKQKVVSLETEKVWGRFKFKKNRDLNNHEKNGTFSVAWFHSGPGRVTQHENVECLCYVSKQALSLPAWSPWASDRHVKQSNNHIYKHELGHGQGKHGRGWSWLGARGLEGSQGNWLTMHSGRQMALKVASGRPGWATGHRRVIMRSVGME